MANRITDRRGHGWTYSGFFQLSTPVRSEARNVVRGVHSFLGAGYAALSPSLDTDGSIMPGYHLLNILFKSLSSTRIRSCSKLCAPSFVQGICCFFTKRLLMTSFTVDSTKALETVPRCDSDPHSSRYRPLSLTLYKLEERTRHETLVR